MSLLNAVKKVFAEETMPNEESQILKEEITYRRNGKSIDKITKFDERTGVKLKTTHFDYFDDKKIRSIDEFDKKTGKKFRTINYVLYKSIDEFDLETGKKIRTINFNIKDENKISSIQEYNQQTEQISTIYIYKRDGKTISVVKHVDSEKFSKEIPPISIKNDEPKKEDYLQDNEIPNLIDKLYQNQIKFENIK